MMAQAVTERVQEGDKSTRPYPVPPTSKSRSSSGYRNVGGGDGDGDGGDAVAHLPAPRGGGEGRRRGGRRRGGRWVAEAECRWSRSSSRAASGWSLRIILYDNNK